jgi:site-specific DNA-cytosine methylase
MLSSTEFHRLGKDCLSLLVGCSLIALSLSHSPGQPLPEFPQPTHGPSTGVPFVTLGQSLENICPMDCLHDVRYFTTPRHSRIDLNKPFPGTVMTSNASHVFPDGRRLFTKRELARIQTFPDTHILGNAKIERSSWSLI